MDPDEKFMTRALELAKLAETLGEVPVGALVVIDEEIVGEGYNQRELMRSCLAHAETMALAQACEKLGRWRLSDATVYSTLEPCIMCTGALLHARIKRLVFGAFDPKFGAIASLYALGSDSRLNHSFVSTGGVFAIESAQMLKLFFKTRRMQKNN